MTLKPSDYDKNGDIIPDGFNPYVPCRYRTDNDECIKTNEDCFIDDVPRNCPILRGEKK